LHVAQRLARNAHAVAGLRTPHALAAVAARRCRVLAIAALQALHARVVRRVAEPGIAALLLRTSDALAARFVADGRFPFTNCVTRCRGTAARGVSRTDTGARPVAGACSTASRQLRAVRGVLLAGMEGAE